MADEMVGHIPPELKALNPDGWKFWQSPKGQHVSRVIENNALQRVAFQRQDGFMNQRLLLLGESSRFTTEEIENYMHYAQETSGYGCRAASNTAVNEGLAYGTIWGEVRSDRGDGLVHLHADNGHQLPLIQLPNHRGFLIIDSSAGRAIARSDEVIRASGTSATMRGDEEFDILVVQASSEEKLLTILTQLYSMKFELNN